MSVRHLAHLGLFNNTVLTVIIAKAILFSLQWNETPGRFVL